MVIVAGLLPRFFLKVAFEKYSLLAICTFLLVGFFCFLMSEFSNKDIFCQYQRLAVKRKPRHSRQEKKWRGEEGSA